MRGKDTPTVCLNMIVKDEAHVIERCLSHVKPMIDHWVIVDTGSKDGTQELIRRVMAEIPGTLHERPWKNFGHNRSEAIALAEGEADYVLTIDADEILEWEDGFSWGSLSDDAYLIYKRRGARRYRVMNLVRSGLGWHWEGAVHEHLDTPQGWEAKPLDGISILSPREGARSLDPLLYRRDALMLEAALLEEPDNTRNIFYLAQSYRDAEDFELAMRHYRRRAEMGGWSEEVFVSLYQIARLKQLRGDPWPECLAAYLAAHQHTPQRAEPLYDIGMYYSKRHEWANAWLFLEKAARTGRDDDFILFIEGDVYDWRAKLEAGVAGYYIGEHDAAIALNETLLSEGLLPEEMREIATRNIALSKTKMAGAA